jgi:hypothetical protein
MVNNGIFDTSCSISIYHRCVAIRSSVALLFSFNYVLLIKAHYLMKKNILIASISLLLSLCLSAQQNHFIYIQADDKQPFYVKINDKVYSSSTTGYIILSKLTEAIYNLNIGFPKNEWPEQKLTLAVQKSDLGYMLKNFNEKGWGLVDMSNYQIVYNNNQQNQAKVQTQDVAATPTQAQEVKKEETKPIQKVEQKENNSTITKLLTSKSINNIEITYLVYTSSGVDTVKVNIPTNESKDVSNANKPLNTLAAENTIIAKSVSIQENKPTTTNVTTTPSKVVAKSNCKNIANEDEYKKLRKKMAAAESDNEMVYKASQSFQKQCFTTEQIKTLSFLFLNEEGKYKFFDAAYKYVADTENFNKLSSLLTDEYYVNRFNAMLKN